MLLSFFTIPYIVRGLGVERYGVLSLAWAVIGYFCLVDIGLGRATTKFVAEAIGRDEQKRIPEIVSTSLLFITMLAVLGSIILIIITPFLVRNILKMPASLVDEAKIVFYIASFSVVIMLLSTVFIGILEAYQRFDIVNKIRIPSSLFNSIIVVGVVFFTKSLPAIVLLIILKNTIFLFLSILASGKLIFPGESFSQAFQKLVIKASLIRSLFTFGGWMTVIFIFSLLNTHLDRFFIGSLLSVSDVSYYCLPFDIVHKLWILPVSTYAVLFPAFSAIGLSDKKRVEEIFAKASKYTIILTGSIVIAILLYADRILLYWLGEEFAKRSTFVFKVIALAFLFNMQGWIPSTFLQGTGRVDIVGKVFIFELPFYILFMLWLINIAGINGVAIAWLTRSIIEMCLFGFFSWRVLRFKLALLYNNRTLHSIALVSAALCLIFFLESRISMDLFAQTSLVIIFVLSFLAISWFYLLLDEERSFFKKFIGIRV